MCQHLIADRRVRIAVGAAAFLAGSLLIRSAYDGEGRQMPWPLRPFAWW